MGNLKSFEFDVLIPAKTIHNSQYSLVPNGQYGLQRFELTKHCAYFPSWRRPLESLDLSGTADLSAACRDHTISLDHLRPVTHDSWKLTTTHWECTVASIFGSGPPFWISPSASIAPFTEGLGTNHPNWFSTSKNLHELCSAQASPCHF